MKKSVIEILWSKFISSAKAEEIFNNYMLPYEEATGNNIFNTNASTSWRQSLEQSAYSAQQEYFNEKYSCFSSTEKQRFFNC